MKRSGGFSSRLLATALALMVAGLAVSMAVPALAAPPQPSYEGTSGLLRIPTTENLPLWKLSIGAFYDFQIARQYPGPGTTTLNILNLTAGLGICPRTELGFRLPLVWWQQQLEGPAGGHDEAKAIGDMTFSLKAVLLRNGHFRESSESGIPLNLAVVASYKAPTGKEEIRSDKASLVPGLSTGKSEASLMGIVDVPIGLGNKDRILLPGPLLLNAGLGAAFPFAGHSESEEPISSYVVYQGGLALPIFGNYFFKGERLTLEASLHGGSNELKGEKDQVIQGFTGARYAIGNGLAFGAGVDFGLTDSTVDDYRGIVTISWSGPVEREEVIAPVEKVTAGASAPAPTIVEKIVERERVILPDVNFEFDKSKLTPLGKGKVYLLGQRIKQHKAASVVIEGHCDERGTEAYNMALGLRRAERVKAELVRLGIPEGWVQVQSFGESRPLIPEHADWAWSVNRRVEVVITPTEGGAPAPAAPAPAVTPAKPPATATTPAKPPAVAPVPAKPPASTPVK